MRASAVESNPRPTGIRQPGPVSGSGPPRARPPDSRGRNELGMAGRVCATPKSLTFRRGVRISPASPSNGVKRSCFMARVTVEDCVDKIPNRFDLVLLAAQRARQVSGGFLPISRRTTAPGTPGCANQIDPSTGFGTIEYEPPRIRLSSAGSAGSFCSV